MDPCRRCLNMGEDGLMAAILEQGTDNYYQLYLSLETQAFGLQDHHREAHPLGFGTVRVSTRHGEDYYPPPQTERVQ